MPDIMCCRSVPPCLKPLHHPTVAISAMTRHCLPSPSPFCHLLLVALCCRVRCRWDRRIFGDEITLLPLPSSSSLMSCISWCSVAVLVAVAIKKQSRRVEQSRKIGEAITESWGGEFFSLCFARRRTLLPVLLWWRCLGDSTSLPLPTMLPLSVI